jgi:predicted aspartyl protease
MSNEDNQKYLTYGIVADPQTQEVVKYRMPKFEHGSPKEMLDWLIKFKELCQLKGWNVPLKFRQLHILLGGDLIDTLLQHENDQEQGVNDDDHFQGVLETIVFQVIPDNYHTVLETELYNMKKTRQESVQDFTRRFKKTLTYIKAIPREEPFVIADSTLTNFFKKSMPKEWQDKAVHSGQIFYSINDYSKYFQSIELHETETQKYRSSNNIDYNKKNRNGDNHKSRTTNERRNNNNNQNQKQNNNGKWCSFHKSKTHNTKDCKAKKNQEEEHKHIETTANWNINRNELIKMETQLSSQDWFDQTPREEFNHLQQQTIHEQLSPPMRVQVEIINDKKINALIDSGCSKSLISKEIKQHMEQHKIPIIQSKIIYTTATGQIKSMGKVNVQFKFPQVSPHEIYHHMFEVIPESPDAMVIGRDLLTKMGMVINFQDNILQWGEYKMKISTAKKNNQPTRRKTNRNHESKYKTTNTHANNDKSSKRFREITQQLPTSLFRSFRLHEICSIYSTSNSKFPAYTSKAISNTKKSNATSSKLYSKINSTRRTRTNLQ